MDDNEAHRRIAALTAIVQMLIPDSYGPPGEENAMTSFRELANEGDPLASAISNELTEPEIEQALGSTGRPHATHEAALRATPVHPYLTEEQRERARVMRVAEDAVDQACSSGNADPERTIIHALIDTSLPNLPSWRDAFASVGAERPWITPSPKIPQSRTGQQHNDSHAALTSGHCPRGGLKSQSAVFHRLEHHCVDVAACFEAMLYDPVLRARLEDASGGAPLRPAIKSRVAVIAFLHDFAKLNTGFQFKVLEANATRGDRRPRPLRPYR